MTARENIEWKDEYTVGEVDLDFHHRQLLNFLKELMEFSDSEGQSSRSIEEIFDDLVRYTEYHFSAEERYMQLYQYPQISEHKKYHDEFTLGLSALRKEFKKEMPEISQKLTLYLKNWLVKHILTEDKKYAAFCREYKLPEH